MKKLVKIKFIQSILISLIILTGCSHKEKITSFFPEINKSERAIQIDTLVIDTIRLEKIQFSSDGFLQIYSNYLTLFDKRFGLVYDFDITGKLAAKYLGQGRGPGEINSGYIEGHTLLKNGIHVFIGSSWDIHLLDKNWKYIKRFTMDWNSSTKNIETITNPDPHEPILYTLDYANLKLVPDSKNNLYLPIYSEHPYFNGLISREYYEEGRILLKLDLSSGKVTELLGRRSQEYLKYKFLPQHATFSFDIDINDYFYISHEIDSLIYVYDRRFHPLYSFGFKGKNMNTDYTELSEFDAKKFRRLYFEDRPKKGYYKDIYVCKEADLIFRSYSRGIYSPFDGLQIYKSNILIGDVDVPKGFKVAGYIPPYFYSDIFLDENLIGISVMRFKLSVDSLNHGLMKKKSPKLIFENDIIDVGRISNDTSVIVKYFFTNSGDTTLIIENVKPDCICTSYNLSSDTIRTGEKGFLEIKFNSEGKTGEQKIFTVIKSNSEEKYTRLLLKAYVI